MSVSSGGVSSGKVSSGKVLVTGASRGIGRAVVEALIARGARVAVVGRDDDALVKLARAEPRQITVMIGDLSDSSQRDRIVRSAAEALGGLDGLVCAAGIAPHRELFSVDEANVRAQLDVNLIAPLMLSLDAARVMAQGGGGAIVHVSSTLGLRAAPGTLVYAATKAALNSVTQGLALELAPYGVRVNAVLPGIVDTAMARAPRFTPVDPVTDAVKLEEQLEAMRAIHPLGRLGAPEEIAAAVTHLLDADWMTGSLMVVDGGASL